MKERKKKENITTSKKETKGFSLERKKERWMKGWQNGNINARRREGTMQRIK